MSLWDVIFHVLSIPRTPSISQWNRRQFQTASVSSMTPVVLPCSKLSSTSPTRASNVKDSGTSRYLSQLPARGRGHQLNPPEPSDRLCHNLHCCGWRWQSFQYLWRGLTSSHPNGSSSKVSSSSLGIRLAWGHKLLAETIFFKKPCTSSQFGNHSVPTLDRPEPTLQLEVQPVQPQKPFFGLQKCICPFKIAISVAPSHPSFITANLVAPARLRPQSPGPWYYPWMLRPWRTRLSQKWGAQFVRIVKGKVVKNQGRKLVINHGILGNVDGKQVINHGILYSIACFSLMAKMMIRHLMEWGLRVPINTLNVSVFLLNHTECDRWWPFRASGVSFAYQESVGFGGLTAIAVWISVWKQWKNKSLFIGSHESP